ncbi:MAG: VOC family protein [Gemmatimonadetes bacterium]|nr:VOC family protein [Gemmatimonadota bacterium]
MRKLLVAASALLVPISTAGQLASPNAVGVRFAHVHLYVSDVDLNASLWSDLLGGQLLREAGYTALAIPGALIFFTEQEPTGPSAGTAINRVGFKVRDLDVATRSWQDAGYEVDAQPIGDEGPRQAHITMPNGARVELTEDPDQESRSEMYHVNFATSDPQGTLEWYRDLLSGSERTPGASGPSTDVPGSSLNFELARGAVRTTRGAAIDHVGFEVEDIHAFSEMMESKGVEFEGPPFYVESLDLWVVFFLDPTGARLEITQGLYHFGR